MKTKITFGRRLLETLTIALYEDPIVFFREYVQNSRDAYDEALKTGSKEIKGFHVSIEVERKLKKITIADNGYGIQNLAAFEEKMKRRIGDSEKIDDKIGNIGFRGIGRISGLPFCEELVFRNKAKGALKIQRCTWKGRRYKEILNDDSCKGDLSDYIDDIVTIEEENLVTETPEQHFFEVTLHNYTEEISTVLGDGSPAAEEKFKKKLVKMLPLSYKDTFKGGKKILEKYKSFMGERLERFMVPVKYEGADLYKTYDDRHILKSDIVFWEIRGKQKSDGAKGDKIGLLWFTFEPHLKASSTGEDYGILTRSKNVLMGTNETFAQIVESSGQYITTYTELAQALRGITGEMLINYSELSDNARRDWFISDSYSNQLRDVIVEFMRRLHAYRYCASRYYRKNATKDREDLKKALDGLVDIEENKINYNSFYKREPSEKEKGKKATHKSSALSEEDIPNGGQSLKKYYDIIMPIVAGYFEKIKDRDTFLKLRAHVAKHLREVHNGTNTTG